MGSLFISSMALSLIPLRTRLTIPSSRSALRLFTLGPSKIRTKVGAFEGDKRERKESMFIDENGAIEDMEGYLDYLSLEYDSVWDTKPSWCQPWTITLTGLLAVACSWAVVRSVLVTSLVAGSIGAWWFLFLYLYPKSYSEMIADRRRRVADGVEDTFGQKKNL
ncbi:PREDICTED: uncharacterized protein LOC104801239 [Tarenaya hassleriana]|uniref:uncharacterized protein LOC104801239 n=1 Tax=Tarenaya hassleriana TaxID=28532 RepID=UPI00053C515C|nr:PREDICTED: uncharacterized protein LOC104801239 [Tarenaya hassleriana]